ncbi:MAG TPA: DinB family protein [Candidatus Polarisedimenticolia bacterium]|nr:DinB family protein [Candidatus Polarisedimenticolia bacterium]
MPRSQSPAPLLRPEIPAAIDRAALVARYRRNRERSKALFDLLAGEDVFYRRPIALRHPFIFYVGHVPAFSFTTLVRRALGGPALDPGLETLFERGIDPPTDPSPGAPEQPGRAASNEASERALWPDLSRVRDFAAEADARVLRALGEADLDRPGHPFLDRGEAAFVILEHEEMHQETLLYMMLRLDDAQKRRPLAEHRAPAGGTVPRQEWIDIPGGRATLGVDRAAVRFAWDNECPAHTALVPAFAIERHDVTNAAFMEFIDELRDQRRVHGVRRCRRLRRAAMVARRRLELGAEGADPPSVVLGVTTWRVALAWNVRAPAARGGGAGLRHAGRSVGLRALAWRAAPDGG